MHDSYRNPLCARYAGKEMQRIFSDDRKFSTWRKLWIALAESEQELGLPITDEQIAEMKAHITDIDYESAAAHEHVVRHDVMAHVHTYGECCPKAMPIIHLGATSCYVCDNTDIILMREALLLTRRMLVNVLAALSDFAETHKALPTLAYTHFQAAQPTTMGKRATLWAQDILMDIEQLDFQLDHLKLLGCKGTTGTGASFLALFDGDADKVVTLEKKICEKMGFDGAYAVSGQTYSRKVDYQVLQVLCGIAQSAAKFSNDIRLLSHLKVVDEPFESGQIGSSAMAYKRNPMRSERIASLARYVMSDLTNASVTAAYARRLGQPPHQHPRGLPCGGRHFESLSQHRARHDGLSQDGGEASDGRAAVHGDREYHDVLCQGKGRRPSGAARGDPQAQRRGGKGCEAHRSEERSSGAHCFRRCF